MGHSDSLPPVPPRFVAFAWWYHPRAPPFVSRWGGEHAASAPGDGSPGPRPGFLDGDDRASQVPGGSSCRHALLSDPGGISIPSRCGISMWPSTFITASAPAIGMLSRLNHTAYWLAVYASQPGLPRDHARLASGWWLAFAGRDWLPAGSH